ncbi:MAG: HD-GYP domain-containing protein [Elusimicrobia bacterium]|nr:HD-GYP domain-containing protein [Elusimicrobiota bacterium]
MASPWVFWVIVFLCVGLIAALAVTLQKLYDLKSASAEERPCTEPCTQPQGWERLDELLTIMLALQEHNVSHSDAASREDFAQAVMDGACRFMGAPQASLMLWDDKTASLSVVASKGLSEAASRGFTLKSGEGIAGKVFETGQPISVPDALKDPRYVKHADDIPGPLICVPLILKSKPVGVISLHGMGAAEPFSDCNVRFLTLLAAESACILYNFQLVDNLQTFYMEMVQTLARAVDTKDAYTREHSDRARVRARRLAIEAQLPEPMVRYVEYAALLHDIGKIGIDEAILLKPGKLTAEEYEVMKRHPMIGHQILAPVKFLGPVAQMVLYHQEWYNGQGYPEGLKGPEIPMGARIVAVIDAWDAMTSDRPYRKALGREKAVAELRRAAGTQFDPHVVEVFLRIEESEWNNGRQT